ncbi:MAG: hypothetical protein QM516_13085, partial [Limnohabitans sp.]|nr:hypothetical protein [Limnohabitans sp.]
MSIIHPKLLKLVEVLKNQRIGRALRKMSQAGLLGTYDQITPEVVDQVLTLQKEPQHKGKLF